MYTVDLQDCIDKMDLECLTPDVDISKIKITQSDINRPALQLAGFFDYFDHHRVQIIGHVENTYMEKQGLEYSVEMMGRIMSYKVPCIVYCRDMAVPDAILEVADKAGVPILRTKQTTSSFSSELNRWLKVELAPRISIHGVLVDIYGEGVLITGESGIGKSEAALELIRRGHRLVTDDVVEIRKINEHTLVGTSPAITRHFIELRGIGIVDVKTLFGVEAVKEKQNIDLVIKLEDWKKENEYDRLGLEEEYTEILGNQVVCHSLPIRPGRNLAVICESAAVNHRQKKMGYNAAQELYRRVQENLNKTEEDE